MGKLKTLTSSATFIWLIAISLLLFACKDDEVGGKQFDPSLPVTINSIVPDSGGIATPIVIKGHNFGTDKSKVQVFFDDREAVVVNVVDEFIYAMVPRCPGGETTIKVVVDSTYEATLEGQTFNYIVSARVTSVGTDYFTNLENMMGIAADDEENLAICQSTEILLYSGVDNKMATILQDMYYLQDVCFSSDKTKLFVVTSYGEDAVLIILDKEKNWSRDIIFPDDNIINDVYYWGSVTAGPDNIAYLYGIGPNGGSIYQVDANTREVTKLGDIALESGRSLAYNPEDGYLYLSIEGMNQIVRVPAKEGITYADMENVIGGGNQVIETGEIDCAIYGIDFDQDNNLYAAVCDLNNLALYGIYQLNMTDKEATLLAGSSGNYADGTLEQARFEYPMDVSVNSEGFIYVMEYFEARWVWEEDIARLRCIAIQ